MTDSDALREWISSKGLKLKAISKSMGISAYSLSKKIDNLTEFKASEISVFTSDYGMDAATRDRIFFTAR